jgi:hypothetical protein
MRCSWAAASAEEDLNRGSRISALLTSAMSVVTHTMGFLNIVDVDVGCMSLGMRRC